MKPTPTRPTKPAKPLPVMPVADNPFADLTSDNQQPGRFIMLYSEAGEGKTTLAAQFPDPLFITTSGEQGIMLYRQRKAVPASVPIIPLAPLVNHEDLKGQSSHKGWTKCLEAMTRFRDGGHDRKTLVIDSISGLQDLCFQHGACKLFGGDMDSDEFTGYHRGYAKCAEAFWSGEFLPLCLEIVAEGYNVVLIAHSEFKTTKNPTGPDYDQFRPALHKSIFNYTKKDLHAILFISREINVAVDQKTKVRKTVGDRKFIGMSPSPYYVAKSWITPEGMTEVECGDSPQETWKNLSQVLF